MADLEKAKNSSSASSKEVVKKNDAAKPEKKNKNKVKFTERVKRGLRDYKSEMKKIVWFGKSATIKSTVLVVVAIVVSAIFIGVLDFAFSKGIMALGSLI